MKTSRTLAALIFFLLATTIARADMLDNAIAYIEGSGVAIPPGWTIQEGSASGAPGEAIPDGTGGGVIEINPDGINAAYPSIDGNAGQYGGVLVVVILHELEHAKDLAAGDYEYTCNEVSIQHATASSHCWLVCHILDVIPAADVSPLCAMYADMMNSYNNGVNSPGGASTVAAQNGCSYPGDIGSCECCP